MLLHEAITAKSCGGGLRVACVRAVTHRRALYMHARQVVPSWAIGREHLAVAVDHELRAMQQRLAARPAAFFRTLVAGAMLGEVLEYRAVADGQLVAWSVTICKGDTARGQWFYQRTEWSKKHICEFCCARAGGGHAAA
jgi:hypothetical protein